MNGSVQGAGKPAPVSLHSASRRRIMHRSERTDRRTLWTAVLLMALICAVLSFSAAENAGNIITDIQCSSEIVQVEAVPVINPAEGYIYRKMYPQKPGMLRAPRPSGNRLEGADRYLYEALVSRVGSIASGSSGAAVFSFPVEEVYGKLSYTAADLNVESIRVTIDDVTGFRKAAVDAIRAVVTGRFSQTAILRCLLADCPYEMYWYDKTIGNILNYPAIGLGSDESGEDTLVISGSVTFNMAVSEEYRDPSKGPRTFVVNGQTIERYCDADPSWGQSVTNAVRNAQAIVDRYEDLEDYERLIAYRDEIKALTGYNEEAAAGGVPYGNPWQLVWVFDGDPETKVVCEGFAKAFQYLNDLSGSAVTVISVTGLMNGGSHMWNIVRMDDGQNYLADLTNCYTDEVSGEEYLFLTGGTALEEETGTGYSVVSGKGTADYVYDGDNGNREPDELSIPEEGYLEAKPPVPVFIPGDEAETFLVGESLAFTYQENPDTAYDSFLVKVIYTPRQEEEDGKVFREGFTLSDENVSWQFGPEYHMAGTYRVQFAGKCGLFTSLWSDAVVLEPGYLADLGRIGFTAETLDALAAIFAGDEGTLTWNTADAGISGFTVRLTESGGIVQYEQDFSSEETGTGFLWTVCPGDYMLSFVPAVEIGYAYNTDDPRAVTVQYSGKEWVVDSEGTVTKYFGSDTQPAVPEEIGDVEVTGIAAGTFEKSRAEEVTVPSVVGVSADAFYGSGILTVYGYENSDAESAAEEAGLLFISLGVKPDAPVCRVSSARGYTGYTLVIRLAEETDAVKIRETGETVACEGLDVLIPLNEAGEETTFTLAAVRDGVRGDYGVPVTVRVEVTEEIVLHIPEGIGIIEDEAFRGIRVSRILIPDSVQSVGAYAFADNPALQVVEGADPEKVNAAAFDQCEGLAWCFVSAEDGFSSGKPFLLSR